jgi:glutathione reductase (NADPH)
LSYDADLFVIGAGSGGVRAARFAGSLGAKVIVAESGPMGGTCVNVGCVPKKLMVYASEYGDVAEDSKGFGWSFAKPTFDWSKFIANKDREISRLNDIYLHLLERTDVEVVRGFASFVDAHTVKVGDKTYTAERILIATGGHPVRPPIPGAEFGMVSDDLFTLDKLPKRIAIVGGGYIGVEFAGILHGVGVETVVLQRSAHVLRGFDLDIQVTLREEMRKKGIDVRVETSVIYVAKNDDGTLCVDLDDKTQLTTDCLMWATGRKPNTAKLNLEAAGVKTRENGSIIVEGDDFQTSVPHIHAVGDVIGTPELTPVALEQGMAFAKRHYGAAQDTVDLTLVPTAVFSQPNVGTVGLTEQQARTAGLDFDIYRSRFRGMRHTMTGREEKTMMKLVVNKSNDRVIGCHMVGPDAGEIIQGLAVAMLAGATKAMFDATLGIHPTAAEEFVTMRHPVTED